jgi:hypothetical protein
MSSTPSPDLRKHSGPAISSHSKDPTLRPERNERAFEGCPKRTEKKSKSKAQKWGERERNRRKGGSERGQCRRANLRSLTASWQQDLKLDLKNHHQPE